MSRTCPACGDGLWKPEEQRFCGSCGEPINVEVDRERIRSETSGFLGPREVSRIAKKVQGDGRELHEHTHVRVQEEVRHALKDFYILTQWEAFDNRAALRGDLERKDDLSLTDEDVLSELNGILGTARFLLASMSPEAAEQLYRMVIVEELRDDPDVETVGFEDIEVDISISGRESEDG